MGVDLKLNIGDWAHLHAGSWVVKVALVEGQLPVAQRISAEQGPRFTHGLLPSQESGSQRELLHRVSARWRSVRSDRQAGSSVQSYTHSS